jgi:hypothetical protein
MNAERWYRLLLRAYPPAFRAEYGREMTLAFRQCRHEGTWSAPRFWAAMLWDVARSAPAQRLEELQVQWTMNLHIREGAMKTMGILATLIGALEVINSLMEGLAGGLGRPGTQLLSVALGLGGGLMLMLAGVAMLRLGARGASQALGGVVACLLAFATIAFAAPVMSIFAMLLGIGFPAVLLAYLLWRRGRDRGLPGVA